MAITLSLDDLDRKRKAKQPDKLTIFIFLLLKDRMTFGEIETLLAEMEDCGPLCADEALLAYVAKVKERILDK